MNNLFMLIGRITKDLELRYTKDNKAVCDINIAVSNGKDDTSFIKVAVWNKTAETTAQYCKKGDLIGVRGLIKNHNWEDEERNKHYDYTFLADRVSFLSTKKSDEKSEKDINEQIHENDPFEEYAEKVEIDDNFLD